MRLRLVAALFAMSVACAQMAHAQASVARAADIWLQGQDEESLTMLADLARNGNADARLLLGRIEKTDLGPSPYRLSMSTQEARSLFRDMSGYSPFGRSWLAVEAAEDNEYARIFLRAAQPYPRLGLIERLDRMKEHEATDYPVRIMALYGAPEKRQELREAAFLMDDLKPYLDYLSGTPEPRGDGLAALRHMAPEAADQITADAPGALGMAGLLALGFGYGDHSADNPWRPAVENWLLTAPSAQPVAALCKEECGAEAGKCAVAFMALMGGYFETIRIDSPFEKIIPQDDFLQSPRARLMVLRRAALARTETNLEQLGSHAEIAEISTCAADLVTGERSAYRHY